MNLAAKNRPLAELLAKHSYLIRGEEEEPFRLASGRVSRHYFECKRTTMLAEAMPLIGEAFFSALKAGVTSVGGLTHGADPIAAAVAYFSVGAGQPINAFSVRKARKEHGTKRWVEGCVEAGETVAIVDDVITSGQSVIKSIDRSREEGIRIAQVIVLVDREEGGLDAIQESAGADTRVRALFTKREIERVREELDGGQLAPGGHRENPSGARQAGRPNGSLHAPA